MNCSCLLYTSSCSFFEDDEEAEPGKLEAWLDKVFGEKLESALMTVVMIFSFVMAIGIFMVLPLFIAKDVYKRQTPTCSWNSFRAA